MYKFSIITVTLNAERLLKRTVDSVKSQTYNNYEHILIDGNSIDGTEGYVKSINHENLTYLREADNGIYEAMNKGLALASGEYVLFLNAGDEFSGDRILEDVSKEVCYKRPMIVYGGANVFREDGDFIKQINPLHFNKKNLNRYATRVVCHQSIFVHRNVARPYNVKYKLKAELNWYYDLSDVVNESEFMKLDGSICNYYLGGAGDRDFVKNYIERIKVTKKRNNFYEFVSSAPFFFIPLIFRLKRILFEK